MVKILIINGPNLNLLGVREPEIYGRVSMDDYLKALAVDYPNVDIDYFQSNHEGELVDRLQEAGFDESLHGIILNAGAYTHTSLALYDAIKAIERPVVEVHISNPQARAEEIRHRSLIAPACRGTIAGFGMDSYRLAIESLL
ncbi:MAG: 3-dehydroquinate dehydratase [Bacteroidales bacterium]|nr:3-dehydroquinate dehydratase [Bacteroidales bacterium]